MRLGEKVPPRRLPIDGRRAAIRETGGGVGSGLYDAGGSGSTGLTDPFQRGLATYITDGESPEVEDRGVVANRSDWGVAEPGDPLEGRALADEKRDEKYPVCPVGVPFRGDVFGVLPAPPPEPDPRKVIFPNMACTGDIDRASDVAMEDLRLLVLVGVSDRAGSDLRPEGGPSP